MVVCEHVGNYLGTAADDPSLPTAATNGTVVAMVVRDGLVK